MIIRSTQYTDKNSKISFLNNLASHVSNPTLVEIPANITTSTGNYHFSDPENLSLRITNLSGNGSGGIEHWHGSATIPCKKIFSTNSDGVTCEKITTMVGESVSTLSSSGLTLINGTNNVILSPTDLTFNGDSVRIPGPTGPTGPIGSFSIADYFALMPPDNAETVAVGGDVAFPQDGVPSGTNITRTSSTQFTLNTGLYHIMFQVSVNEPGQLCLTLGGVEQQHTVVGRATGTTQSFRQFNCINHNAKCRRE